MSHPEPDLLRTYVAIVETGSFTAAARLVHRTQSAVSMQMRRLERSLDCSLFDRGGRKIRLTPDGEIFLDHARRILWEYDQSLAALTHADMGSEITLGVPDDYALTLLPEILRHLSRAFPSFRLTIVCEASRRLRGYIAEGSLDVALLTEGEGAGGGVVLCREELVWVTSARHNVHERDPVPVAVFHSGDVFRRSSLGRLAEHGRRPEVVVTSASFAGINAALDAGIAVAVISRRNVRPGLRILTREDGFPELPHLGIILQVSDRRPRALVDRLSKVIVGSHG